MEFLAPVATILGLPLFLAAFAWYAVRARRCGSGGSLMGPFEEIWDPIAYRTNIEVQVQAERSPETPTPGDPPSFPVLVTSRTDAGGLAARAERTARPLPALGEDGPPRPATGVAPAGPQRRSAAHGRGRIR